MSPESPDGSVLAVGAAGKLLGRGSLPAPVTTLRLLPAGRDGKPQLLLLDETNTLRLVESECLVAQ